MPCAWGGCGRKLSGHSAAGKGGQPGKGQSNGHKEVGFLGGGQGWGWVATYLDPLPFHQFLESSHCLTQGVQDELGQQSHKQGAVSAFSPMRQEPGSFPVGAGLIN